MVILETTSVTKIRRRDLSDVQMLFIDDDTIAIRGTLTIATLEGASVVRRRALATITLSGAALETALNLASLPTSTVIKTRFRNLFQAAWTNQLGEITVQGTEADGP